MGVLGAPVIVLTPVRPGPASRRKDGGPASRRAGLGPRGGVGKGCSRRPAPPPVAVAHALALPQRASPAGLTRSPSSMSMSSASSAASSRASMATLPSNATATAPASCTEAWKR